MVDFVQSEAAKLKVEGQIVQYYLLREITRYSVVLLL